ncbi:MAG: site-2 protease family protein [Acidobacteriota bacterium]|nr:site-2 protease family protein [Acidobacteriota bacterium]
MHPPPGPPGPSSLPIPDPVDRYDDFVPVFVPAELPPPDHGMLRVQLVMLAATLVTTTLAGGCHYYSFSIDLASVNDLPVDPAAGSIFAEPMFWVRGLWDSLTILAILGCHEMGHYIACLRYGVEATRPYFLPAPVFLTGTLGAFIRIRTRIPNKIALFDIGIAGPRAGFVVAVPALFIGVWLSRVDRLPADASNLLELGEPLRFRFAAWLIWGDVGDGYSINMHPMAFAAWFGLLATALNLFPIAQLDGGPIAYAVFGHRATPITIVMVGVAVGLTYVSSSWIAWTVLLVIMIALMGPRHPPTLNDDEPLDRGRLVLAGVALAILIVCFTPAPIGPFLGAP